MNRLDELVIALAPIYMQAHLERGIIRSDSKKRLSTSEVIKAVIKRAKQFEKCLADEELNAIKEIPKCPYEPHGTQAENTEWYDPITRQCRYCGIKIDQETT